MIFYVNATVKAPVPVSINAFSQFNWLEQIQKKASCGKRYQLSTL